MIKLITAYTKDRLIGKGDQLPWRIAEELAFFKEQTLGTTIVMGDVTFKGLPGPLPGRKTIVLTLDETYTYDHPEVEISHSLDNLIKKYKDSEEVLMVCGGATIYKLFLPYADEIIVSHLKEEFEGNVYFPEWDESLFDKKVIKENNEFTSISYTKKLL